MGNCVSSVIHFFHSSFFSTGNSCTSTAPQHQIEAGNPSTSTARQDQREQESAFYGITSLASSSSSTVMKKGPWDVFINHRGCDTKVKLASTIYHTLDLIGLRAFLDVEELELGDSIPQEIQEAMRTAGLHIAIFSRNYAESPWCLAELLFMLKTGNPILPVFYHVQPTDLRWVEKGCYAQAFSDHEKKGRYPSTILEEWKSALQKVSYVSGYMLTSPNDDEGKLLKSIVNFVLGKMKKVPLEVAKHPVAMDEIVKDFERSQGKSMQGEQQIVGIVGFGGSGKTTLATEFYNRKSSSFDRSSCLYDVRDAASKNDLHTKQKKLLGDLRIQSVTTFDNAREGKGIVADRLKGLRVLIVLDDVDHEDQLDALLPPKESLGSGSLVIVTTREGHVLTKWGIASIYKIKALQRLHARKLFCWHAFLQPFPQQGFEDLVENCLDVCNGLPLSLKVIGGQLYGKRCRDYWVSQIEKIRKILPKEILQRLKVSYDALDDDEKEMFMDVACFFIGKRRSSAISVWDGSGWSGLCSWETLHNKCLVEVDEEECIRMHDHLRDLVRDIATTHSPSRIWSRGQSIQRGMPIRGIMNSTFSLPMQYLKECMEMMRISNVGIGLQLLLVDENEFTQECGELSKGLLWLRWSGFNHGCIPSWLSLENIRVLEFIHPTNLKVLWEDAHPPLELRELIIDKVYGLQSLPRSIGHLKHLKRLYLSGSSAIDQFSLPEEFCRLQSLEHLVFRNCRELSSLPDRFGDLVNLRHVGFQGCSNLQMLPVSFKQLIHLEYLNFRGCSELTLESDILENIINLKVFNVKQCYKLQVLPHEITNQASLRRLRFSSRSRLRELPASIGQLSKLEKLEIVDLPLLPRLPISLGNLSNLVTLSLVRCPQIYEMPSLAGLVSLNSLRVEHCPNLYEMPSLAGLVSLNSLHVKDCPNLYEMPSLAGLVSLNSLHVEDCPKIKKIEGLDHLTSLEKVLVRTDWVVPGIHSLRCAERLRTLNLQADNITAFEACIESIEMEKWRWEMTICGKIFPGVQSSLDKFTFPGLVVVNELKYYGEEEGEYDGPRYPSIHGFWSLVCWQTNSFNAAIVCYHVDNYDSLPISMDIYKIESSKVRVTTGEWIVITVLRDVSHLIDDIIPGLHRLQLTMIPVGQQYFYVCDGWLIVGERGSVIEGFKQLFQTLCKRST